MEASLYFGYLNLDNTLKKFYDNNIDNVDATLIISLEKEYYMGENMKLIMSDLRKLMKGKKLVCDIDGKLAEFKVNSLKVFICDTLNVHTFYYRHCAKYFNETGTDDENLIPFELKKEFEKMSFIESKEAGQVWFRDNIDAFNLFSDEKVINKDFLLDDGITTVFEETEETPKLECIRYEYYYKLKEYYKMLDAIEDLKRNCDFIDRAYTNEAEYFYDRLKNRNEAPEYKELFLRQSRRYLTDETVPAIISTQSNEHPNNNIEFYYYGKLPMHLQVYCGKKGKNSNLLNQYIDSGLLKGINDVNRVTLREQL